MNSKYWYLMLTWFSALFLLLSQPVSADDSDIPSTENVTAKYLEISGTSNFHSRMIPKLKAHKTLLVAGFMSSASFSSQKAFRKMGVLGRYFEDQIRWFKAHQVDFEEVAIESEATSAENAFIISDAIQRSDKPVIMLTHSKGGLDTLETFLSFPNSRTKVEGWISLQTPFWGTPVADAVIENKTLRNIAYPLIKKMGGASETIISMTTTYRSIYVRKHWTEIKALMEDIPTVALASWKWNTPGIDTVMEPMRNWMQDNGYPNDGAVPYKSAILPFSWHVVLSGVDHAGPVMYCSINNIDRHRLTRTLFTLLIQKMEQQRAGITSSSLAYPLTPTP